ncbi:sce7726 family protein [Piscinibacter terrae]|uniref:Sce7726 family protein n=1 Tax=Piscinibacter terrae TaxID=2496871 RepID=A0A3N7JKK6_9BURK|nr:sce7726 family protein [Albitalea terrae]RQP21839.1 hypothetical protein DZC73_25710 [Albitalea terrae]
MLDVSHDHQVRAALKAHLQPKLGSDDLLVDEFGLAYGAARADLALVNGHLEGFEIKAARDTLTRLPSQVEAYGHVFEMASIVTTRSHLAEVRPLLPKWWGIMLAVPRSHGIDLLVQRQPRSNPRRSAQHLARLLWRDETLAALSVLGLDRGLRSKPKLVLFDALAAAMPVDELADYVRTCLKARGDWRSAKAQSGCDGS